jgi:AraC-like DNA-binding protein
LSGRALRLAKLKLQEPRAGDGAAVNLCGCELPVLRCVQGLVGEVAAWARPVDGSLGDIAFRIDFDTDSYFEVALNGAKDFC